MSDKEKGKKVLTLDALTEKFLKDGGASALMLMVNTSLKMALESVPQDQRGNPVELTPAERLVILIALKNAIIPLIDSVEIEDETRAKIDEIVKTLKFELTTDLIEINQKVNAILNNKIIQLIKPH